MRCFYYMLIICLFTATSCKQRKSISDMEFYGNTFINLSDNVFYTPENWKDYVLGDGEFEISMPPYMGDNSFLQKEGTPSHSYLFNYRDSTGKSGNHYGRIAIDFINDGSHTFNKATDYLSLKDQYDFWEPIVEQALKGGEIYGMKVPDGKMLNGLHCKELRSNLPTYIYDAFYRRGGHIKGEGAVSVHMFYMMNKKEAVMMTISHYDKDSVLFKNLFNVVKTFRWREVYQ